MLARLNPAPVFRAHWRALSDYRQDRTVPDHVTRFVMVVLPVGALLASWTFGGSLRAPDSLLAGVALLAGVFLAAFTHLSGLRSRLTERENSWGDAERVDRDSLDETCAHLLAASYVSGVAVAVLVLGMNLSSDDHGAVTGLWAHLSIGLLVYVLLLFLVMLPRLYSSYATSNRVRPELSGLHRD